MRAGRVENGLLIFLGVNWIEMNMPVVELSGIKPRVPKAEQRRKYGDTH